VSEANRVFVFANIDSGSGARTLLGFYQFNGDIFTGLYVMNTKGFTDAQVAKWLKVSVTMASRLKG
jgi:membrane-bound inhibitor of C-type lysozyme